MKASPVVRRRGFGYYILIGLAVGLALFIVVAVGLLFARAVGSAKAAPAPAPAPVPASVVPPAATVVPAAGSAPPVTAPAVSTPGKPAATARPMKSVKAPAQPFHGVVWPAEARSPKVVDPAADREESEEMAEEAVAPPGGSEDQGKAEAPASSAQADVVEQGERRPGRLKRVFGSILKPFRGKK